MDRFDWLELESDREQPHDSVPLASAPADGPSYYQAARKMRDAGYFQSAVTYYRKAIGFDEHNYSAWVESIDCLVRANMIPEADRVSSYAHDTFRKVRAVYAARALVLGHLHRWDEAQQLCDVGLGEPENLWYARCVRGELYLLMSREFRLEALCWFDEALLATPNRWEPAFLAGLALFNAGLHTWAAGYLSEAAHLNPRAPIGWLYLGDAFRALRLYEPAGFYYNRVLELDPNNREALDRLQSSKQRLFGLMNVFIKTNLYKRWRRAEERLDTPDRSSWIE